jgi:pimeloyl-ACP methyl ester carboxylesterase
MIFDLRDGNYEILRDRLRLYFETSSALGMQMAVQCAEEIPFSQPEDAFSAAQGVQPQIAAFFPASVEPLFAVCQDWGLLPLESVENQPVHSEVPALVLAGEYDPITPPAWGESVAGDLTNAFYFAFPGNGHWVTRSSTCALEMALAFWEDPASAPDSSCIGTLGGLDFRN